MGSTSDRKVEKAECSYLFCRLHERAHTGLQASVIATRQGEKLLGDR